MIDLNVTDGGREAAGFRGSTGDCVTRAIAIAAGADYREVYDTINTLAVSERPRQGRRRSGARTGVKRPTLRRAMERFGGEWVPVMGIGTGTTMHLRADEIPGGVIVVSLSRHVAAVVDRVLHDTYDCSRDGTRCVYGYWIFEAE